MKYAYNIEAVRKAGEKPVTLPQKRFDHRLSVGSLFEHENYELRVTKIVKDAQGGEPEPGHAGRVRTVVEKDLWVDERRVAETVRAAERLGWRFHVERQADGSWEAFGAEGHGHERFSDLASGQTKLEAAERGLAAIRNRAET